MIEPGGFGVDQGVSIQAPGGAVAKLPLSMVRSVLQQGKGELEGGLDVGGGDRRRVLARAGAPSS